MFILLTSIFFVLAFYFLYLGLRVVVTKKPLLQASRNTFWLIALAFLPNMLLPISSYWELYSSASKYSVPWEWADGLPALVPFIIYPALLTFYWRILRGYGVLGVTDESFRQALYSVLNDLDLPFEERLSKLHFPSLGADLEANVNGWLGSASIRVKQKEHQELLDRIAAELRSYFAGSHVAVNLVTPAYYLIFGVGIFVAAVVFTYFSWMRPSEF